MAGERILVIEDDRDIAHLTAINLSDAGYEVETTVDGTSGLELALSGRFELVVLDLMLPGTDGIELMQQVPELADLPVIFISAYRRDETIARALELGAADYLVKPFSPTELVARVRAALSRRVEIEPFQSGELRIRYDRREVTVAGRAVALTATEYELLRVRSVNAGRVVTRDVLLRRIWGMGAGRKTEALRTCVKKLRRKLGGSGASPSYISNERGVGYRLAVPADR